MILIPRYNGLPINENVYITDSAFKETVGKELEKRGTTVEYVDLKYQDLEVAHSAAAHSTAIVENKLIDEIILYC